MLEYLQYMSIKSLSVDQVLLVHKMLTDRFASTSDPISPPGIRDDSYLSSAVNRQFSGMGAKLKYSNPYTSAAALAYGVCHNHPFHNGNKRTALVSMLGHLHINGLKLVNISHDAIYGVFVKLAGHILHSISDVRKVAVDIHSSDPKFYLGLSLPQKLKNYLDVNKDELRNDADLEVFLLAAWLSKNSREEKRYDRDITLRQLKRILSRYGIEVRPGTSTDYHLGYVRKDRSFNIRKFRTEESESFDRKYTLSIGGENREIGKKKIKEIRRVFELDNENGVDASNFYGDTPYDEAIDSLVLEYGKVLSRLAKT